jgi:PLP dependent protein
MSEDRAEELSRRLATLRARISAACAAAGRDPDEVALLAVTKTVPAADVALLLDLGLSAFGENRAQEADPKVAELAALRPGSAPHWHFVGGLQRNKVRTVVRWADRVASVDSARLVAALDSAVRREQDAGRRTAPLPVLVQYSVDGDPQRGGVPRSGLEALVTDIAGRAGLRLAGLMSVAPMGADLEIAIRHGSNEVRVGTALVGERRIASR